MAITLFALNQAPEASRIVPIPSDDFGGAMMRAQN